MSVTSRPNISPVLALLAHRPSFSTEPRGGAQPDYQGPEDYQKDYFESVVVTAMLLLEFVDRPICLSFNPVPRFIATCYLNYYLSIQSTIAFGSVESGHSGRLVIEQWRVCPLEIVASRLFLMTRGLCLFQGCPY